MFGGRRNSLYKQTTEKKDKRGLVTLPYGENLLNDAEF